MKMAKGETDYEIWELPESPHGVLDKLIERNFGGKSTGVAKKKLAICDTQANALKKLAKLKWPKNGLAIIPVRRKK